MDPVEKLYEEGNSAKVYLTAKGEISLSISVENSLRKSLVLASASYFEHEITKQILEYTRSQTTNCKIISFLSNKALSRQYHTFFQWDGKNVNSFLGLFGEDFKGSFQAKIKNSATLEASLKKFLELGNERNRLVHQNFANYSLEKTSDEIKKSHIEAKGFVNEFSSALYEAESALANQQE
jgi:hypothetical protein